MYVGSTIRCQEQVLISTGERSVLTSQRRAQKGLDKTKRRSHRKAGLIRLLSALSCWFWLDTVCDFVPQNCWKSKLHNAFVALHWRVSNHLNICCSASCVKFRLSYIQSKPVWPSGKALGWRAERHRFDSALIQTHKRLKRTLLFYYDKAQHVNFRVTPFFQATKPLNCCLSVVCRLKKVLAP